MFWTLEYCFEHDLGDHLPWGFCCSAVMTYRRMPEYWRWPQVHSCGMPLGSTLMNCLPDFWLPINHLLTRIIIRIIMFLQRGDAMKSYSSREIISIIEADGWYFVHSVGDHWQYKHPIKPGRVTVTHPVKDIPIKTVLRIFNQAQIDLP